MRIEIVWQRETTEVDLAEGVFTLGGATEDGICLAGLPDSMIELTVEDSKLSIVTQQISQIGSARFPAHVARLVLEGDTIVLTEDLELRRPVDASSPARRQRMDTAFVAKALLQGLPLMLTETRAATLTCVSGPDAGTSYPLAFSKMFIGRSEHAELRLHDRSVSRQHAKLFRRNGHFFLEPSRTTNGVYLNGRSLRIEAKLNSGDVLELGQSVLRFDGPEEPAEIVTVLMAPDPDPLPPRAPEPERAREADAQTHELPKVARAPIRRSAMRFESWLIALGVVLALTGITVAWAFVGDEKTPPTASTESP